MNYMYFLLKIGSVEQAKEAIEAGVDAIIVQGLEAGGHVLGKVSVIVVFRIIIVIENKAHRLRKSLLKKKGEDKGK